MHQLSMGKMQENERFKSHKHDITRDILQCLY